MCSINESISGGDAAATLSSLKSAPVGIRSITDDCAATYQEKLAEAKQQKLESSERDYTMKSLCVVCRACMYLSNVCKTLSMVHESCTIVLARGRLHVIAKSR